MGIKKGNFCQKQEYNVWLYTQASKFIPARMPGAAKIFAGPVNSSYWLPAQHSKLEPLRLVKAVQDFSGGCFTSIGPQIDVPFIK